MGFWAMLVFIAVMLVISIVCLVKLNQEKKEPVIRGCAVFAIVILSIMTAFLGINIPDAIRGGQEIYVQEAPRVFRMQIMNIVFADGRKFISFDGYDSDDYEEGALYRIRYTKISKIILDIEKVEDNTEE